MNSSVRGPFRCLEGPEYNTSEWGWTSENQVLGDNTDTALHLDTSASPCNSTTITFPDPGTPHGGCEWVLEGAAAGLGTTCEARVKG